MTATPKRYNTTRQDSGKKTCIKAIETLAALHDATALLNQQKVNAATHDLRNIKYPSRRSLMCCRGHRERKTQTTSELPHLLPTFLNVADGRVAHAVRVGSHAANEELLLNPTFRRETSLLESTRTQESHEDGHTGSVCLFTRSSA